MEEKIEKVEPSKQIFSENILKDKLLKQKLTLTIAAIALIAALFSLGGYLYLNSNKQISCTAEAKLCPDGSSVDRTGPNCEFAKCPTHETTNWKTYTNEEIGISFLYPSNWGTLKKNEELCLPEGGFSRTVENLPCVHISLAPSLSGTGTFFSSESKQFAKYGPGRGGFWGDSYSFALKYDGPAPAEFINSLCSKNTYYSCIKNTNSSGISFVKILNDEQVIESTRKANYYYVLNKDENFPIIILSNQSFLDNMPLNESEALFDKILSTFKFTQ